MVRTVEDFKKDYDRFKALRDQNGFESWWSMYEIQDMNSVAFPGKYKVAYVDHWGGSAPDSILVENPTWMDLWKAADTLIKKSGDAHHIFIENFRPEVKDNGNFLFLVTGS
jgi:hypothetical protein